MRYSCFSIGLPLVGLSFGFFIGDFLTAHRYYLWIGSIVTGVGSVPFNLLGMATLRPTHNTVLSDTLLSPATHTASQTYIALTGCSQNRTGPQQKSITATKTTPEADPHISTPSAFL